jgi:hypothetical protein
MERFQKLKYDNYFRAKILSQNVFRVILGGKRTEDFGVFFQTPFTRCSLWVLMGGLLQRLFAARRWNMVCSRAPER